MEKKPVELDIKVYEPANMYEVPFALPSSVVDSDSNLRIGYHTLRANCTEQELSGFQTWASSHENILKVIGVRDILNPK